MRAFIKKLFDWTPRDIAYWEKIRQKGLGNFVLMYGVVAFGGLLFIIFGLVTLFSWLKQAATSPTTPNRVAFLLLQLLFVLGVSLLAGIINSLITWVVEEKLYNKYKRAP